MKDEKTNIDLLILLRKYIKYVNDCEGTDFIHNGFDSFSEVVFTEDEWKLLCMLSKLRNINA